MQENIDDMVPETPESATKADPTDIGAHQADSDATETEATVSEEKSSEGAKEKTSESAEKEPEWFIRETTKERNRRREAEARAQQLEQELAALRKPQESGKTAPNGAPIPEAYPDGESDSGFIRDTAIFYADQRFRELQAEQQKANTEREAKDRLTKREAEFIKSHSDYRETMALMKDDPIFTHPVVLREVVYSDNAPDMAYFLAKHPEELAALSDMTEDQAVRHLSRISGRLAAAALKDAPIAEKPAVTKPWNSGGAGGTMSDQLSRAEESENADAALDLIRKQRRRR